MLRRLLLLSLLACSVRSGLDEPIEPEGSPEPASAPASLQSAPAPAASAPSQGGRFVELSPQRLSLKPGVEIAFERVFGTAPGPISASSLEALEEIGALLARDPSLRLRVEVYSNTTGTPAGDLQRTAARAEALKAFWVERGIDPGQIEAIGCGGTLPIEAGRRLELIELWRPEAAPPTCRKP